MGTLDETIHITLRCVVHIHGHWNRMVPFMKPFILANLNNDAKFATAPIGRLMTLEITVFHVRSITITSAMKTWSFQVM